MVRTKNSQRTPYSGRNPKAPRVQLYFGPPPWIDHYDPPHITLPADKLNSLVILAQLAIYRYNLNQDSNYEDVRVLRAERCFSRDDEYKIVFEASLVHDNNNAAVEIFQAEVVNSGPGFRTMKWVEIKSVKIKSTINTSDDSTVAAAADEDE